jgi:hypothetical protein
MTAWLADSGIRPKVCAPQEAEMFVKTLKWPVVSLLITGMVHFILEAVESDLQTMFIPAVLAALLLAYGLWVGYRMVQGGGSFIQAIVAGLVLGLLPLMLDTLGFGLILGRGLTAGLLAGLFGLSMILWGALAGSGFALSGQSRGI